MNDPIHTPQHNELQKKKALEQHEVREVLGFLNRYGKLIGIGLLAAAVAGIGSSGLAHHRASRRIQAEQRLTNAKTPAQLEEIIHQYSSTPTAPVALLSLAKIHFNNGEFVSARAQYERFLKKYKKHELRLVAELGLAYCTEADGDFDGASAQFSEFAKQNAQSYLHAPAILSMARCMEQAGRTDQARIVLEDFLVENAGTAWVGMAEKSLQALSQIAPKQ